MKTDPENTDYTMEHGASRNYEPWRAKAKDVNTALAERQGSLASQHSPPVRICAQRAKLPHKRPKTVPYYLAYVQLCLLAIKARVCHWQQVQASAERL